jgi:hypothetical protein
MKIENSKPVPSASSGQAPSEVEGFKIQNLLLGFAAMSLVCLVSSSVCQAVSSKITRHATGPDLLKGKTSDAVIGSRGTIQLGRAAEPLVEDFKEVWSVNSIVVSGGTIYVGTSPNGGIYKYGLGKLTKIYPVESPPRLPAGKQERGPASAGSGEPNDANKPAEPNKVEAEKYLSNEHIFAMTTDVAGRLLAGISGKKCRLCRFEADKMEVIFEPNDAKYIFAIAIDDSGDIYLGTGPKGKVYRLNSFGKEARVVYDSRDKNILSLTSSREGFIYGGSDGRGLVYKIDPRTKTATILYDSEQPEITALLFTAEGDLHAAATSAKVVQTQADFAAQMPMAGRPDVQPEAEPEKGPNKNESVRKLKIANMKEPADEKAVQRPPAPPKGAKPGEASYIYKISKDGFVTEIFSEPAIFFCLAEENKNLLVGTGNSAQLFAVDPASEQETVIYEDEKASQITALSVSGEDVYVGTANPAKLIKLGRNFAAEGTYTSDLIDAGQPATWGKLQIEADIPEGCKVKMACRSGNVKDVNDPTFSAWTELVEVTDPVQLGCPLGRFCQYKLVLQSTKGLVSPTIRAIAVANTVPNLAPKVESVTVGKTDAPGKTGVFKISFKAKDDNSDKLIYKIEFRKVGRTNWVELKDQLEADSFEWDGKTVEDGRYEVRVTASDERANTSATKLTGSRISDPVVIDNTSPVIKDIKVTSAVKDNEPFRVIEFEVSDELSTIGQLEYTIDSNTDWIGTVPNDLVYDTTDENFTIEINAKKKLPKGEHIITIKVSDAVGNTTYKTLEVNGEDN